jgi:hypothetical protein
VSVGLKLSSRERKRRRNDGMKNIFKSKFPFADKAAEFLADYGPVYQIKSNFNRFTKEQTAIIIDSHLDKIPEGWIGGRHFHAIRAEKEQEMADKPKITWIVQKKIRDLSIDPEVDYKVWRNKADIFSKMVIWIL